jgi:hypothetical protein
MSKATIKRFLTLLSSAKELERVQLYQLLQKAEQCHCLKDKRSQYEFGKALEQFSYPFNLIGGYYQSFYLQKTGQIEAAYEKLGRVHNEVKGVYADKALLSISSMKELDNDLDGSMRIRLALTKSEFLPIAVESAIGVAAILGSQREHDKALKHIEAVLPLIPKLGNTPLSFDVQNSYATELAEVGKIELASQVITPVILSPYAPYYPNWPETEKEIREKSSRRSIVAMKKSNVIDFPTRAEEPEEQVEEAEPHPSHTYDNYLVDEFKLQDKVEDWIYGGTEPDDLGTLMVALAETDEEFERDLIIERVIDSTFTHTEESKEAKSKWRDKLLSKMK